MKFFSSYSEPLTSLSNSNNKINNNNNNNNTLSSYHDQNFVLAVLKLLKTNPILTLISLITMTTVMSITPISLVWFVSSISSYQIVLQNTFELSPITMNVITLWSFLETLFFFYQIYLIQKIQTLKRAPKINKNQRENIISTFISHVKEDGRLFISKWFFGTDFNKIRRENFIEWLCFVFFGTSPNLLDLKQKKKLSEIEQQFLLKKDLAFKNGKEKNIKFMKHVIDSVPVIPRPFVFYIVTDLLFNIMVDFVLMSLLGYKRYKFNHFTFWSFKSDSFSSSKKEEDCKVKKEKIHEEEEGEREDDYDEGEETNAGKEKEPIVFFHGIGTGLIVYLTFLIYLHQNFKNENRRIILLHLPWISMRFPTTSNIASMKQTLSFVENVLQHFQSKSAIFLGHSYGSACLSWIIQNKPHLVSKSLFIDPICFELNEADIVFNFCYRKPKNVLQLLMWYFVCTEFGISYIIRRHFWWHQNILFPHQIPSKENVRVFLSGNDFLINTRSVRQYLDRHDIKYHWAPHHNHGGFLMDISSWNEIISWINY